MNELRTRARDPKSQHLGGGGGSEQEDVLSSRPASKVQEDPVSKTSKPQEKVVKS